MATRQTKSVSVLGAGGFLGSHLVRALLRQGGWSIVAVDQDFHRLVEIGGTTEPLRFVKGSICNRDILHRAVEGCDTVLSLTAMCNPSLYNTTPVAVIQANYSDLAPVVSLCEKQKKWLIHFSTCEVYGLADDDPLDEARTPLVLGPIDRERWTYACAKQLLERLIWARGTHGSLRFTIVRPFNVIGPQMDFLPGIDGEGIPRVLACFMNALLKNEPLPLVDGGDQRRAFIGVEDFCDAVLRVLANQPACAQQVLNIGNPQNDVSIAQLAQMMIELYAKRTGQRVDLCPVPAQEYYGTGYDDVKRRVPTIEKIKRLTAWQPHTSLERMLPGIVDDYLKRYRSKEQGQK